MPPKHESTRSVDRKSRIANYLNHFNEDEQDAEKALYEDEEPFAKYKCWEEFARLAISTQILEKGGTGDTVRIINSKGDLLLSAEKERKKLPDSEHKDDAFHRAMRHIDYRAREHGRIHARRYHGHEARRRRQQDTENINVQSRGRNEVPPRQASGNDRAVDERDFVYSPRERNMVPKNPSGPHSRQAAQDENMCNLPPDRLRGSAQAGSQAPPRDAPPTRLHSLNQDGVRRLSGSGAYGAI